jgi:hypothetical protein
VFRAASDVDRLPAELRDPDGYMINLWDQVSMQKANHEKSKN